MSISMRKKWTHNSYPIYTHRHRTNQNCSVVSAPTDSGIYHGQPWGLQHTYEGALTRLHNIATQPVCGDFVVAVSNRVILLWWLKIKKKKDRAGWVRVWMYSACDLTSARFVLLSREHLLGLSVSTHTRLNCLEIRLRTECAQWRHTAKPWPRTSRASS